MVGGKRNETLEFALWKQRFELLPVKTSLSIFRQPNHEPIFDTLTFDLQVEALEPPTIKITDMQGEQTVVQNPDDGLELVHRVNGRPRPSLHWTLNGKPLNLTVNTTRVR